MRKLVTTIVIVIVLALVLVAPALAMESYQEATPETLTIFAILKAIFTSLMAAAGIGSALSFLIQLGKIYLPKWFPDDKSQNWRLGTILVLTAVVYIVPVIYPPSADWLNIAKLDQLARDFAEFGALIVPLFVASTDWISKKFYMNVLRGSFIGKSYTPAE